MKIRKLWLLTAILGLLLCLCACSRTDENAGRYIFTSLEALDTELDVKEAQLDGMSLELYSDGKGRISSGELEGELSWTLEEGELVIQTGSGASHGKIEDGVMTLDLLDSGAVITLIRVEAFDGSAEQTAARDPMEQWWEGGWYGWWRISNATGSLSQLEGCWYDCCGEISFDSLGALLTIWDEDCSRAEPMAQLRLSISQENGKGEMGAAISKGGYFWLDKVGEGDWLLDPALNEYDNMLIMQDGEYRAEDSSFDYELYLRPWGQLWEDIEQEDPEMLPFYYYDWYLPLAEAGSELPDRIG